MPGRLTRLNRVNTAGTRAQPRPRVRPRGIPPALERHPIYASDQPAEASVLGRDLWGPHSLRIIDQEPGRFRASLHAVLFRDVTLGYLDYGAEVEITVGELTADQLVIVPAIGTCTVEHENGLTIGTPVHAIVPASNKPMTLRFDRNSPLVILRIERTALDVHVSRLLGHLQRQPLEFDAGFDLSEGTASRWNFAVQSLHAELLDESSLLHKGIGIGPLEESLMSALLYSHRSNYSPELAGGAKQHRASVRFAMDFIEANLSRPLTIADIAEAAGVSVRSLQNFFAEDLQQSPTAFIRNRRLERVRADLADAAPGSRTTVSKVATRWGFTHLGRFASTYQQRFGEPPSKTLRS